VNFAHNVAVTWLYADWSLVLIVNAVKYSVNVHVVRVNNIHSVVFISRQIFDFLKFPHSCRLL